MRERFDLGPVRQVHQVVAYLAGKDANFLFGTDTPLYFAAMQRMRIELAEITEGERRKILSENARLLLKLK